MQPLLMADDEVLVHPGAPVEVGDVVVARHPHRVDVHLVKRVVGIDDAGRLSLEGDNPNESTDSRTLGTVPRDLVVGRVTSRF
jgi:nickel-type superoxide dismutase maturation protease